ncbi:MAG TPA: N-acetylmuramic acid 6-phosphate etherase [Cytophagaceae bacterium]
MNFTESPSRYHNLEKMPVSELLQNINREDKTVPDAVEKAIPQIEKLVYLVVQQMKKGGRLFYIGAGTSGRLAVVDASECPPTFGVDSDQIIAVIAGGDTALRKAVEDAEDNREQAWNDLQSYNLNTNDVVLGITASGAAPYVTGGLEKCRTAGIATACITCNPDTPVAKVSDIAIEVITGPEFVTGSTRMKAGTAQKLVLNMISTAVMIQLGRVKGNKMVDMQLTNNKLRIRGINILKEELGIDNDTAKSLLNQYGSVRKAIEEYRKDA